eukprot:1147856-Pelagomonas_calceolata.AAC.6
MSEQLWAGHDDKPTSGSKSRQNRSKDHTKKEGNNGHGTTAMVSVLATLGVLGFLALVLSVGVAHRRRLAQAVPQVCVCICARTRVIQSTFMNVPVICKQCYNAGDLI